MIVLLHLINGVSIVKVYHGTILSNAMNIIENGIDLGRSKNYLDFGKGFYTTTNIDMAKNMARRCIRQTQKDVVNAFPVIITFEYAEKEGLNYKKFEYEDMEWAKFILANRVTPEISKQLELGDNNYDLKYDIISGGTADGVVATKASELRFKKIPIEEFEIRLEDFLKEDGSSYGEQIVFCTPKALSCIEYIK